MGELGQKKIHVVCLIIRLCICVYIRANSLKQTSGVPAGGKHTIRVAKQERGATNFEPEFLQNFAPKLAERKFAGKSLKSQND